MSTNDHSGSAFGRGVDNAPPTAAAELRRRMATSPAGFLRSAAWVPWRPEGTPDGGSVAHVVIRDKPFVRCSPTRPNSPPAYPTPRDGRSRCPSS